MPFKREDLSGQAVTVRMEDGTEVEGHVVRYGKEDLTGEDTAGHGIRIRGIDLEVDDTRANLLAAANERGEPVYVRFPDGAEVKGHAMKIKGEDLTGEDTSGHVTPPQAKPGMER
jgi:hypothetical protein